MAVDLKQVLGAILTFSMFIMLGNMVKKTISIHFWCLGFLNLVKQEFYLLKSKLETLLRWIKLSTEKVIFFREHPPPPPLIPFNTYAFYFFLYFTKEIIWNQWSFLVCRWCYNPGTLVCVIAIEIKRKAPRTRTGCEIVKASSMTNIIVTFMLLLGGSAVVNALNGLNIYASSFLIPLDVIVYTLAGELKDTFLASYIDSAIGA